MRHLLFICIIAMLSIPSALAYSVPGSDAPDGAEVYIVYFEEAGAANYDGGIDGLEKTSGIIRSRAKDKANHPAVSDYRAHLDEVLDDYTSVMSASLSRSVQPLLRYNVLSTGMAVELTASEAQRIAAMDGVIEVRKDVMYQLDTDVGPQWIGAEGIWDGSATPDSTGTFGEGVVVGIFDSGINLDHPSYSDSPEDGYFYVNPFGDGNFVGACASEPGTYVCNNKLIGAWDYADAFGEPGGPDGPEDNNGHGSHTASTAAGNFISGPFLDGTFEAPGISGVARHANIIAYDVCSGGCPVAATISAVNQAILDGVDVINFSIGPTAGGGSPWIDTDRNFLDMTDAGILVSASAGNNGPTPGSVSHLGPWVMTVANQTHNRVNSNPVSAIGGPGDLQDMYGLLGVLDNFTGDVTETIEWAGNIGDGANFEGCLNWTGPYAADFTDRIVLISRGGCSFEDKINFASAVNAAAVIVFNNAGIVPIVMGGIESTTIPSLMIGQADGEALRDHILANPVIEGSSVTVTMAGTSEYSIRDELGSFLNDGSSRGPSQVANVTKPDLGGPGTNVFAAYADVNDPPYAFLSGTSMSSPHAAGAAALLRAVHPDWTPGQVKSALMMTARTGFDPTGGPAHPDMEGTGTVDLTKAALSGLTMDESFDNYLAANPANGGDPGTLNVPSVRADDCAGSCTWQRTVCSTDDSPFGTEWQVSVPPPNGYDVIVTPSTFSLAPEGSIMTRGGFEQSDDFEQSACQTLDIEVRVNDPALVSAGEYVFDSINLGLLLRDEEGGGGFFDHKITIAVLPTAVFNP